MGALVVLAGCGADGTTGLAGEGPGDDTALEGTEWVLVEGVPIVEGHPITLGFEDGRIGGTAACNSYGGAVEVTEDTITIGEIVATEIGCPAPGVHDSESAYFQALHAVERHEHTEDELVLTGAETELRFDAAAVVEDAELTGTEWQDDPPVALDGNS